jgi:hypothetical protein
MPSTPINDSPELNETARQLASLALEMLQQDGTLAVRQREQVRRALVLAADALQWSAIPGSRTDRMAAAKKDVAALAEAGAYSLERDIADLLHEKKSEIRQLEQIAKSVHAMATAPDASYPAEVEYSHTARDGSRSLVTRTKTLVMGDADEAFSAAASLEKRMEGSAKLRDLMLVELKQRRHQVRQMRRGLPGFVEWSNGLVAEVLSSLT